MKVKISSELSGDVVYDLSAENILQLMGTASRLSETAEPSLPEEQERPKRLYISDVMPKMQKPETPETYVGFLLLRCESCGKLRWFCAHNPISEYRCDCGGRTPLYSLKPATLMCRSCGGTFRYKTNVTTERFSYNCLECGKRNRLALNNERDAYITTL